MYNFDNSMSLMKRNFKSIFFQKAGFWVGLLSAWTTPKALTLNGVQRGGFSFIYVISIKVL